MPTQDKRPVDEFYEVDLIESLCVEPPVDISVNKNGELIKYTVKATSSQFNRCVEPNDVVQYLHETRFQNGQLVDFEERRKAKDRFEMSNEQSILHIK